MKTLFDLIPEPNESRSASLKTAISVPKDFPVQPDPNGNATCGVCGLSWDDDVVTSFTPVPAGRCPFEYFHEDWDEEDDEDDEFSSYASRKTAGDYSHWNEEADRMRYLDEKDYEPDPYDSYESSGGYDHWDEEDEDDIESLSSRKVAGDAPVCQICSGTGAGVQFSMFPQVEGYSFGEICVDCEERLAIEQSELSADDDLSLMYGASRKTAGAMLQIVWENDKGDPEVHRAGCGNLAKYKRGVDNPTEYASLKDVTFDIYPPDDFGYDEGDWEIYAPKVHSCVKGLPKTAGLLIYKIETPKGVLPYDFETEQDAKDFAMASLSWTGTKYRIIKKRRVAGSKVSAWDAPSENDQYDAPMHSKMYPEIVIYAPGTMAATIIVPDYYADKWIPKELLISPSVTRVKAGAHFDVYPISVDGYAFSEGMPIDIPLAFIPGLADEWSGSSQQWHLDEMNRLYGTDYKFKTVAKRR